MNEYGYVRVSTAEQKTDRQRVAMQANGITDANIYTDKVSGKDFNRPAYQALLRKLKAGDTLYIKSIDRLGRNYSEIQEQWRVLTKDRGIAMVVLDMPLLDTRVKKDDLTHVFVADLVLQILCYVSEVERSTTLQRQAEGIAAAKEKGVQLGRPPVSLPKKFIALAVKWEQGGLTMDELLRKLKISKSTFYRRWRAYKSEGC